MQKRNTLPAAKTQRRIAPFRDLVEYGKWTDRNCRKCFKTPHSCRMCYELLECLSADGLPTVSLELAGKFGRDSRCINFVPDAKRR